MLTNEGTLLLWEWWFHFPYYIYLYDLSYFNVNIQLIKTQVSVSCLPITNLMLKLSLVSTWVVPVILSEDDVDTSMETSPGLIAISYYSSKVYRCFLPTKSELLRMAIPMFSRACNKCKANHDNVLLSFQLIVSTILFKKLPKIAPRAVKSC